LSSARGVRTLAALDFRELGNDAPVAAVQVRRNSLAHGALAKSSKNSKANRIETGERSGGIGEICSVEVDEK
jgi:hypothetical protein